VLIGGDYADVFGSDFVREQRSGLHHVDGLALQTGHA
jgi:hypothetical protein